MILKQNKKQWTEDDRLLWSTDEVFKSKVKEKEAKEVRVFSFQRKRDARIRFLLKSES